MVNFKTSIGRDTSAIKKTRDPGPNTYDTSKSLQNLKKISTNISLGGLGIMAGSKEKIS